MGFEPTIPLPTGRRFILLKLRERVEVHPLSFIASHAPTYSSFPAIRGWRMMAPFRNPLHSTGALYQVCGILGIFPRSPVHEDVAATT